jgi:hypothetical protein
MANRRAQSVLGAGAVALTAVALGACGGGDGSSSALPTGTEHTSLDPANFMTEIDNPYWPMKPGSRWIYRETDNEGAVRRDVETVTNQTKAIAGIQARVVHDVVSENGEVIEDTFDWYAQDADGNVWYLGEDTKEFENGKLKTTEGSWEAGMDGAEPGVIVPAKPQPGVSYREEYYKGHAEDGAEALTVDAYAKVPAGTYHGLFQTRNFSPLEPDVVEEKFYAKGIGPVLEITASGGSDRAELLSYSEG